jgi:hypothetical protein
MSTKPAVYLFQIDGAQNNDAFFNSLRSSASFFYKGSAFRVGDWIPDGVRVDVQESHCFLTLIELEDTKSNALISARKYLPENSDLIVRALGEYLDRIVSQCVSTGDSRESGFAGLRDIVTEGKPFVVRTACALRSSTETLEELSLIDQPSSAKSPNAPPSEVGQSASPLQGTLRLGRERLHDLQRSLKVLDAVIRHQDHSAGLFHSWSHRTPLKRLASEATGNPVLKELATETIRTGMKLDFEALLLELVSIWTGALGELDLEDVRRLISKYLPIAHRIKGHDRMDVIFEDARKHLRNIETNLTAPPSP